MEDLASRGCTKSSALLPTSTGGFSEVSRRSFLAGSVAAGTLIAGSGLLLATQSQASVFGASGMNLTGPQVATNMLLNGDFESVISGKPKHWEPFGAASEPWFESSQERVRSGDWSVRLEDRSATSAVGFRSAKIEITPGSAYRSRVFAYTESGQSSLYLEFWDANNTRVWNQFRTNSNTGAWQQIEISGIAPAQATHATVLLYSPNAAIGITYFDDAELFEEIYVEPELFGPAALTGAVRGVTWHQDLLYITGRFTTEEGNLRIAAFDTDTGALVQHFDLAIPASGGHRLTSDGTYIYIGVAANSHVWRLDPTTGVAEPWVQIGPSTTWYYSMVIDGDWLYLGTYPDNQVRRINLHSKEVQTYGRVSTSLYATAVAVDDDYVYGGSAAPGKLLRWPKEGGEPLDLTSHLSDSPVGILAMIYANGKVHIASGRHIISVDPDGSNRLVREITPGDRYVDSLAVGEDGTLYAMARLTSNVYRVEDTELVRLAQPLEEVENQFLGLDSTGQLVGVSGIGQIWRLDHDYMPHVWQSAETAFGMPDEAQSMHLAQDGQVWVGGHYSMTIHRPRAGQTRRIDVRGEPKAITEGADGTIYAGLYPSGEIIGIDPHSLEIASVGTVGHSQMRTRAMEFDSATNQILVATGPTGGLHQGALSFVDVESGSIRVHRDYLPSQSVMAIAVSGRTAYIVGDTHGEGTSGPTEPYGQVAAIDIDTQTLLWRKPIDPSWASYEDIVVVGSVMYLMSRRPNGYWHAYDLDREEIVDSGYLGGYGGFGVSGDRVFSWVHWALEIRELPSSSTPNGQVLYSSIPNGWYNNPQFNFVPNGEGTWGMWNSNLAFFSVPVEHTHELLLRNNAGRQPINNNTDQFRLTVGLDPQVGGNEPWNQPITVQVDLSEDYYLGEIQAHGLHLVSQNSSHSYTFESTFTLGSPGNSRELQFMATAISGFNGMRIPNGSVKITVSGRGVETRSTTI